MRILMNAGDNYLYSKGIRYADPFELQSKRYPIQLNFVIPFKKKWVQPQNTPWDPPAAALARSNDFRAA